MSDNSFIPRQDANALAWMVAFSTQLSANAGTYFISAADAATIASAVSAYETAFSAATNPATRTPAAVSLKDETRNAAEQVCRQFAILIKFNAGISTQAKIDAGVRPVNPDREPIECPQTSPLVNVKAATPGSHTLSFADSLDPEKRAKPWGASDLLLFCAVAEDDVNDPSLAKFVGKFTKNPISVEFTAAQNGLQATYFARWSSRKGDVGPWSLPVSMAIAA